MSIDLLAKLGSLLAARLLTKFNATFFIFLLGIHPVETSVSRPDALKKKVT